MLIAVGEMYHHAHMVRCADPDHALCHHLKWIWNVCIRLIAQEQKQLLSDWATISGLLQNHKTTVLMARSTRTFISI